MSFSALPVFCIDVPTRLSEDVNGVMSPKYWELWNDDIQKKIDADIEKYRKADACVQVGKIKDGTQVSVEQISHDFKFGAHIFNYNQLGDKTLNAKYKSLYGTLFNSATVAFYWNKFEIQANRPRFKSEYWDSQEYWENSENPKAEFHWRRPPTDEVIDYCKSRGVRVHGHAIVWGSRAIFSHSGPSWRCFPLPPPHPRKGDARRSCRDRGSAFCPTVPAWRRSPPGVPACSSSSGRWCRRGCRQ